MSLRAFSVAADGLPDIVLNGVVGDVLDVADRPRERGLLEPHLGSLGALLEDCDAVGGCAGPRVEHDVSGHVRASPWRAHP